jgi:hypothetical protein
MAKVLTPEQRAEAEVLLGIMADSQTKLWDTSADLERILGFDICTTDPLEGLDLDDLHEDICDTPECTNSLKNGEGFNGHCGECADKKESADASE